MTSLKTTYMGQQYITNISNRDPYELSAQIEEIHHDNEDEYIWAELKPSGRVNFMFYGDIIDTMKIAPFNSEEDDSEDFIYSTIEDCICKELRFLNTELDVQRSVTF